MQINLLLLIFLLPAISGGKKEENIQKINLEDIERDNLVNERKSQGNEPLEEQQTQHIRPPGIQSISLYKSIGSAQPVRGGVTYASQAPSHENEPQQQLEYAHEDDDQQLDQVQYLAPQEPQRAAQVYGAPAAHESPRAYSVPSRPYIPAVASYVQQHNQPQYVYIQPRGHQQHQQYVANDIQYEAPQASDEAFGYSHGARSSSEDQVQQQQQHEDIGYQHQQHEEIGYQHQQQHPSAMNYLQYVPYITRGPTEDQSYVMMAPIPAGYQRHSGKQVSINPSIVTYSHSSGAPSIPTSNPYQHAGVQYAAPEAAPQGGVEYVGYNNIQNRPSKSYSQDIQYADPNQVSKYRSSVEKSKQYLFAPKHPEQQYQSSRQQQLPRLDYDTTKKVIPLSQPVYSAPRTVQAVHVPSIQASQALEPVQSAQPLYPVGSVSQIDYFHGRDSKSLLDSYIPSWVVVQRQKSLQQNFATPVLSGYNTISYSIPHPAPQYNIAHYKKRSTNTKA